MASLRTLPNSKYWIACFTGPDGSRTQRSTKVPIGGIESTDIAKFGDFLSELFGPTVALPVTNGGAKLSGRDAKRLAERVADHFEDTARKARAGHLTEIQARRVVADIFALANDDAMPSFTIKEYLNSWLKRKEVEANERTHQRYQTAIEHALQFLGPKAGRDISHLSARDITDLRDHMAEKLSPNSANYTLKVLRAALNQARRDGVTDGNEASRVSLIQRVERAKRRPFTRDELKKVLGAAIGEWRGMIAVGLYTGLRLGDIASLTWANVDLQQQELSVRTQKTGRQQIYPLAKPLLNYMEAQPVTDCPTAPLFPRAYQCKIRNPHGGPLSNQFYAILVAAGLAPKRSHKSQGKGRDGARVANPLSFHCLRHTATSLLKNAGVSDAVARDIISQTPDASVQPDLQVDYVGSLENAGTVISRLHQGEKRLVFCDSRSRVEKLASQTKANGGLSLA